MNKLIDEQMSEQMSKYNAWRPNATFNWSAMIIE